MDGLLHLLLRLHGHCSWVCLWLVTHILLKLESWSPTLALHCSRTPHLLWLHHACHTQTRSSGFSWLLLLAWHTPGGNLPDAPCTRHLPSSQHSLHSWGAYLLLWLHRLPARTHLLHFWWEEWALPSLYDKETKLVTQDHTSIDWNMKTKFFPKLHYSWFSSHWVCIQNYTTIWWL